MPTILNTLYDCTHYNSAANVYDNNKCSAGYNIQRAKKAVFDSLGQVDFAIGLVILFLTCPMGKCCFLGKFKLQKDCNQSC